MDSLDIISLPRHLDLDCQDGLQVYDYRTSLDQIRNKINLELHTFSFLLEGTKEVITGSNSMAIQNTHFLLMKSGHCLMTENLPSEGNGYYSKLFFFNNEAVFEFIRKHQVSLAKKKKPKSIEVFKYDAFIHSFVHSLKDLTPLGSTVRKKLLKVKFEELMLYLLETNGSDFIAFLISNTEHHMETFIQVVENNRLNRLTIKELAFLSNMSISSFKRAFQRHFNQSPIKWFQDQRLEHSAFLLRNESKRPSDIYAEIGYENLSNFIHAFKEKFGVTPKQFQLK